MGAMKKMTPAQFKAASKPMKEVPMTLPPPRPPGPAPVDLPMCAPRAATSQALRRMYAAAYPVWGAINVDDVWRPWAYARWRGRRGAVWLYWRMCRDEMHRRYGPASLYRGVLGVDGYLERAGLAPTKPADRRLAEGIVPPQALARVRHLDDRGGLTREGFRGLSDTEFVWPWPDEPARLYARGEPAGDGAEVLPEGFVLPPGVAAPRAITELEAGQQHARLWPGYWHEDLLAPEPAGGPTRFHDAYGLLLKEFGLAGEGTRLGRWLAAWSARCEAEYGRMQGGPHA